MLGTTDISDRGSLAVLGYDNSTLGVLKAAVAAGFTPVLLHAPSGSMAGGTTIEVSLREVRAMAPDRRLVADGQTLSVPVADEGNFKRFIAEKSVPILVGSYELRERDFFREILLFARNRLKVDGRILHPAMLCDFFRCDQRRFAIVEFSW